MLKEFDLIRHSFDEAITIYPIADVHLGAVEHAETEWKSFLKKVEEEKAYVILAGDLINNNVRSVKFANPFDEVLRPKEAKARMVEYLKPIKDRILCVVTGNHEARTLKESDQDLTYDICSKLDIEHLYREGIAYMGVGVGASKRKDGKASCTYTFAVTHGTGGGIYTGAAVNRNERFGNVVDGLDCLVVGHVHKGFVSKPAKICINIRTNQVSLQHYVVVSCVPWLYYGGYAAKSMLLPAQACDPQKLFLTFDNHLRKKIITTW